MLYRLPNTPVSLERLIQPETSLERHLLSQPEFHRGLLWGEPRFGHPEGMVAVHVREVLDNVDRIEGITASDRRRLRLVSIAHDAFKCVESRARPRDWTKHHGLLARQFLEHILDDSVVLDLVEMHDDAYYAWLAQRRNPNGQQLEALMKRVGLFDQLYYLFFKCDTQTGDKTQAPLRWFEREVKQIKPVVIRPYWPFEAWH